MTAVPTPHRRADRRPVACDYSHAERLLDQYGIAYICRNPGILFGDENRARPDQTKPPYCDHLDAPSADPPYAPTPTASPPHSVEELLYRITQAYRILDEIYAPHTGAPKD